MKKILFIISLIWCCKAQAQTSYLDATGYCIFEAGSIEEYNNPIIFVKGCYDVRNEIWTVTMGVSSGVISASSPIKREFVTFFTKAEIDAFTGSGTGDTKKIQNALDQAVKDLIETLNVSSTVTIH